MNPVKEQESMEAIRRTKVMAEIKSMWIPSNLKTRNAQFGFWDASHKHFYPKSEMSEKELEQIEHNPDYEPGLAEKYYY